MTLADKLDTIHACPASIEWAQSFGSFEDAYNACHDARWLVWIAVMAGYDTQKILTALTFMGVNKEPYEYLSSHRTIAAMWHRRITSRYAVITSSSFYIDELTMIPKDIDALAKLSTIFKSRIDCESFKAAFEAYVYHV